MITFFKTLVFTFLIPCSVAVFIPLFALNPETDFQFTGSNILGLTVMIAGAAGYFSTALSFLVKGKGTPAIFFTKPLNFLLGEEPMKAVTSGLYRFSRNPMYLSVWIFILGLGIFKGSYDIPIYCIFVFLAFHFVVVFIEEPHLKEKFGDSYTDYLKRTRRWL
jgi:protein-S-isoprenylcysteine O-methyltransferase Ste14